MLVVTGVGSGGSCQLSAVKDSVFSIPDAAQRHGTRHRRGGRGAITDQQWRGCMACRRRRRCVLVVHLLLRGRAVLQCHCSLLRRHVHLLAVVLRRRDWSPGQQVLRTGLNGPSDVTKQTTTKNFRVTATSPNECPGSRWCCAAGSSIIHSAGVLL